jgi:hypothetical protein
MQIVFLVVGCLVAMLFSGCATYKITLANEKGQIVTCEATGKSGIVTGYYLRRGFEECVEAANSQGFKQLVLPPAESTSEKSQ